MENYRPGSPIVCCPIFLNDARTRVGAILRNPENPRDVRWVEDERESRSPFIRDVFHQHSEEGIEANTKREMAIASVNRKAIARAQRESARNAEQRALYEAKARALDTLENPALRRLARKADTVERVAAVAAAAIVLEVQKQAE